MPAWCAVSSSQVPSSRSKGSVNPEAKLPKLADRCTLGLKSKNLNSTISKASGLSEVHFRTGLWRLSCQCVQGCLEIFIVKVLIIIIGEWLVSVHVTCLNHPKSLPSGTVPRLQSRVHWGQRHHTSRPGQVRDTPCYTPSATQNQGRKKNSGAWQRGRYNSHNSRRLLPKAWVTKVSWMLERWIRWIRWIHGDVLSCLLCF